MPLRKADAQKSTRVGATQKRLAWPLRRGELSGGGWGVPFPLASGSLLGGTADPAVASTGVTNIGLLPGVSAFQMGHALDMDPRMEH